jgi:hypothetical protein
VERVLQHSPVAESRGHAGLVVRTVPDGDGLHMTLRGTLTVAGCRTLLRLLVDALRRARHVVVDVDGLALQRPGVVLVFARALCDAGGWPEARLALVCRDPLVRRLLAVPEAARTVVVADDAGLARWRCARRPRRVALRWEYAPAVDVPALVRTRLAARLADWGLEADEDGDLVMVVNELVTNAVEHGGTRVRLEVAYDGAAVSIRVRDHSTAPPVVRPFDVLARRGRGLQMVDAIADRWGCTPHLDGKTVWARVTPSA